MVIRAALAAPVLMAPVLAAPVLAALVLAAVSLTVLPGLATPAAAPDAAVPQAPRRVVSINLCTDQLAMLLAAPGQLVSVSHIATDPLASALWRQAADWPANHGLAEEIYLLRPDLVLAGTFSPRPTVDMLRRLGVPVVELPPAATVEEVRAGIVQVGRALGRVAAAQAMLADFDARLAAAAVPPPPDAPTAAGYGPNGWTAGSATLTGEVFRRAGLRNLADRLGMTHSGVLPLESLVMADPDLVVTGTTYPGASRSEEILSHPALRSLRGQRLVMEDSDWICGLPTLADAVGRLAAAGRALP